MDHDEGYDSFNEDMEGGEVDDWGADDDDDMVEERTPDYVVLDEKQIRMRLEAEVDGVADTIASSKEKASILLRRHKWSREQLVSAYFENGDRVLRAAGLHLLANPPPPFKAPFHCRICDDEDIADEGETFASGCGHRFCTDCWGDYLEDRVGKGKDCLSTRCPSLSCPCLVPDSTFQKLVSSATYKKFCSHIARSFVEDNRRIRWCPFPGCGHAVEAKAQVLTVVCKCGGRFCFNCGEEAHAPVSCAQLQLWLAKCRNESETAHWIIANTKKCPKCAIRIEKNQGCNHMTCRGCKYEFCWVCMNDWASHGNHTGGYYKCNKYDPKAKKASQKGKKGPSTSKEDAQAELDRYLHYYQRYHNHDQSKKFAGRQMATTQKRMQDLQEQSQSATWMDVQFLKSATEQVFECRRVLKYTYVFGYYLEEGAEKTLFEYLQQQLETTTEHLSELSEMPLEKIQRSEVVNYERITKRFLANLVEGVENGLTGQA